MDFIINSHNIQVMANGQKLGSIADACCNTNIQIQGYPHPISFMNEPGKGGFISKKLYLVEFIKAFKQAYSSPQVLDTLRKRKIEISKKDLQNNDFLTKLA